MLRIGLVGGVTFGHTRAFLGLFNPRTPAGEDQMPYPHQADLAGRVVALADPVLEKAQEFASWVEGVELVTENPEELAGKVDGVMVCGDPSVPRQDWARHFLRAGLPTFVDKPLSTEVGEAELLVELAEETGAQTVRALGTPEKYHIFMDWGNGRTAVWLVGPAVQPGFRMVLLAEKANLPLTIADSTGMFGDMLRAYCRMIETRQPAIPYASMLEIVKVLDAARWSMETGGEKAEIGED